MNGSSATNIAIKNKSGKINENIGMTNILEIIDTKDASPKALIKTGNIKILIQTEVTNVAEIDFGICNLTRLFVKTGTSVIMAKIHKNDN